ncbi:hypothetical protein CYMTET_15687 [Cymbomonas tetramitiformis]|uniref:PDEase domain-containing protein n=1 Tax=Cymbomonas tetramitiformis TaxID=36881 RepID=A0AAE0L8X1_9CHLO|nr:hypothetical protein CYMTET_15687 [Cymbomonas tetramitiformis]
MTELIKSTSPSCPQLMSLNSALETFPPAVESCEDEVALCDLLNVRTLDWGFDTLAHPTDDLLAIVTEVFDYLELPVRFGIPRDVLLRFLEQVAERYNENPYHNFSHAVDVAQITLALLVRGEAIDLFTELDVFVLITAAVCHDVDHPGLNNSYLVNTRHPLATQYNDSSVLEKYHLDVTGSLLADSQTDIFCGLSHSERLEAWNSLQQIILATDMALHKEITDEFRERLGSGSMLSRRRQHDRLLGLKMVMKCADLGNVTRPWEVGMPWSHKLAEECILQVLLGAALDPSSAAPSLARAHLR